MMHRYYFLFVALILTLAGCADSEKPDQNAPQLVSSSTTATAQNQPVAPAEEADSTDQTNAVADDQALTSTSTNSIADSRRNAITKAVSEAGKAVVSITVTELQRGYTREFDSFFFRYFDVPVQREVKSAGSGFIISEDGLVLTNEHVASKNSKTIKVVLTDGNTYEAELVGADELADISLLRIKSDREKFPYVTFADSDQIMVGEWAIAMGNPFGLFHDGQPSVTVGVVSAKERDFRPDPQEPRVYVEMIQTDAAINRGNSGGPLVNSNGEVMGMNAFIFTGGTSAGFVGLGFAIPSNRILKIVSQLKESGSVSLDYDPGMKFQPVTRELIMKYRNIPRVLGLFVTEVNKNGPAYESGIMPGDVIVQIGEERVTSEMHAWALMREYKEGEEMELHLIRENKQYKTTMELRKRVQGR
ncbi:S1C family serine protease [Gracilimonas mengyeensis]|uniref:Serine protease Do n=1 Tax=Gracilimonas mengyeensis TaxID=1302730 RepID=A0A521DE19_9BACT|nr:trypsin-like peptidase domain-containing protein [Gracilimonas mengyeensis]SMO69886.1 serine protease Do [Gracilimonas mengyeensis]